MQCKKVVLAIVTIGFFICAVHIDCYSASSSSKMFRWKLFLFYPPQVAENFKGWCDDIKKKTNGGLDIKVFYDGEHPFKASDLISAVKDRSCEMANINSSYVTGVEPILAAFELPMMDVSTMSHLYVVENVKDKWYNSVLEPKWKQKVVLWTCYPGQSLHMKDGFLENFDSLKGKKIRIFSKETADWAKVLNAVPVTVPWAEVYTAAQRGVIEGATGALGTVYDSKWHEIFKYITVTEYVMSIDGIHVNMDAWNELPQEYQKVVTETAKEWQYKYWLRREMANYQKNVFAQSVMGCKVMYLNSEFRKKLTDRCEKEVWPAWAQRTGQPEKAQAYINDCVKYRNEFAKMPKDQQKKWLIDHSFPKEALE